MDTVEKYAMILRELSQPTEPLPRTNESVTLAARMALWCIEGTKLLSSLLASLLSGKILPPSAYVEYARDLEQQVASLKSMNDRQEAVIQEKNREISRQQKLFIKAKLQIARALGKSEADINELLDRHPSQESQTIII